jgi:hypothetical protein
MRGPYLPPFDAHGSGLTALIALGKNGAPFERHLNQETEMTERTASEPRGPTPEDADADVAEEHDGGELGEGEGDEAEDAPRRRPNAEAILPWALLAALALIGLALLWSAAESHYRGCVEAVGVRTAGDNSPLGRFARQDVSKCSRSPF